MTAGSRPFKRSWMLLFGAVVSHRRLRDNPALRCAACSRVSGSCVGRDYSRGDQAPWGSPCSGGNLDIENIVQRIKQCGVAIAGLCASHPV